MIGVCDLITGKKGGDMLFITNGFGGNSGPFCVLRAGTYAP
jgi:hypothetical protein